MNRRWIESEQCWEFFLAINHHGVIFTARYLCAKRKPSKATLKSIRKILIAAVDRKVMATDFDV